MEIIDKADLAEVIQQGDVIRDKWGNLYLLVLNTKNHKYGFVNLGASQTIGEWCDSPAQATDALFGNSSDSQIVNARIAVMK